MPSDDGGNREVDFVAADPDRTPAPSRWAELIKRITALSESGKVVTQLHTRDSRSGFYELENGNAVIHGNGEEDYLVTADGTRHEL